MRQQDQAFADDLCLIADSPDELQVSIDLAQRSLEMLGLRLNAAKCSSLHLSGRRLVGVRDTQFTLRGLPLRPLAEGEAATFLGAQVGFNIVPPLSTLAEIIDGHLAGHKGSGVCGRTCGGGHQTACFKGPLHPRSRRLPVR